MKHYQQTSAQIPVLISVLAAGTIMAAVTIILAGNVLNNFAAETPSIMVQTNNSSSNKTEMKKTENIPSCKPQDKKNLRITLTETDNSSLFKIAKGDLIDIKLTENTTTGYSWSFVYNTKDLRLICKEADQAKTSDDYSKVGTGQKMNYYFKSLQAVNTTTITGNYARSFEDNSVVKTVTFTFLVTANLTTEEKTCYQKGGNWKQFTDGCVDNCPDTKNSKPICTAVLKMGCNCGSLKCWNQTSKACVLN